jgi:hypothetical protein
MPTPAHHAPIRAALALDAGEERGVEGVALGRIAPFAPARQPLRLT